MALTKVSGSILKDPLNLGEVSIGGTLTYEDVTNVDSVGLITARSGIKDQTLTAGRVVYVDSDKTLTDSANLTFNENVIINASKLRINPSIGTTAWQRENKHMHQIRDDVYVQGTVNVGDKAGFDATPLGITTFAYTGIGTTGELTVGIATTTYTPTAHAIAEGKNILIKDSASGFQEAYNTLTGSTGLTIKVRRSADPSSDLSIANTKVVVYTPADPRGCLNIAKDFAKFEQNTFNPILRGFVGASTTHPVGINTEVFKIQLKRDSSAQDSVATLLHSTREMGSKQRLALTIDDGDSYPDGKSLVLTQTGVKITNLDDFTNAKTLLEVQGALTLTPESNVAEAIRIAPAVDASSQQEFGIGLAVNSSHTHPAAKITFKEYDASDSRGDLLFYTREANSDSAPTERFRIDSAGRLSLGVGASPGSYPVSATARQVQAEIKGGLSGTSHNGSLAINCTNNNANLHLIRSDNNQSADVGLSNISFSGYDGSDYHVGAQISAVRDAAGGNNDIPARLVFSTTADGASTPTERLRINRSGKIMMTSTSNNQRGLAVVAPKTQINFGTTADKGGFLMSETDGQFGISGGAYWTGSNWTAVHTGSAQIRHDGSADIVLCTNSGLTVGSNFTPSSKLRITATNVQLEQDIRLESKPNSTWGAGFYIGGNGQATSSTHGSMVVTNGNVHIDPRNGSYGTYLNWYSGGNGTYFGNAATGQAGRIDSSGNLSLSGSYPGSDLRLKENIQNISGATDTIKSLVGKTFTWKTGTGLDDWKHYGFIAQEVQKVTPDLVKDNGCHYFDKDDNLVTEIDPTESDEDRKNKGLNQSLTVNNEGVTPILVEAMKELIAKVETLEAEVAALKSP